MRRRRSAVLRLALPGILVFAVGSAAVLALAYRSTVDAVDEQLDALLSGEAADLASEASELPAAELPGWLDGERQDLERYLDLRADGAPGPSRQVLLVITEGGRALAWSGTDHPRDLLAAVASTGRRADAPLTLPATAARPSLRVAGWTLPGGRGAVVALTPPGRADLLRRVALTLALLWAVVLAISSVLAGVERTAGAAARRPPDPGGGGDHRSGERPPHPGAGRRRRDRGAGAHPQRHARTDRGRQPAGAPPGTVGRPRPAQPGDGDPRPPGDGARRRGRRSAA